MAGGRHEKLKITRDDLAIGFKIDDTGWTLKRQLLAKQANSPGVVESKCYTDLIVTMFCVPPLPSSHIK